jgi:hypothetical protein
MSSMKVLSDILAIPLLQVSGSYTIRYYGAIATANSVLWAAVLTYVIVRLASRHSRSIQEQQ